MMDRTDRSRWSQALRSAGAPPMDLDNAAIWMFTAWFFGTFISAARYT